MYSVFIILSVCVALHCTIKRSNIIGLQIGCLLLSGEYPTYRERIRERERGHLYKQVLSIVHFSFN